MNTKQISRIALGAMLIGVGISHLTIARKEFRAQVPDWVPLKKDDTVVYSGYAEIAIGSAVLATPKQYRNIMGRFVAAFFAAVFPGNYAQYKDRRDGFGLDTDGKRLARLFLQPLLMAWALYAGKDE